MKFMSFFLANKRQSLSSVMRKWSRFLVLLFVALWVFRCDKKPDTLTLQLKKPEERSTPEVQEPESARQTEDLPVLLVGADGLDLEVIRELTARGKLPNILAMMKNGAHGILMSEREMRSPPIWTTIATGRPRSVHGIYDFVTGSRLWPDSLRGKKRRLVTSKMRKVDALWNILSHKKRTVAVVGWLNTWPAEEVNGVMVSSYVALGSKRQVTIKGTVYPDISHQVYPDHRWKEVQPLVVTADEVEDALVRELVHEPSGEIAKHYPILKKYIRGVRWSLAHTLTMRNISLHLICTDQPDLTMVYFEGSDSLAHRFWLFRRPHAEIEAQLKETGLPTGHAEELAELYGGVLDRYYVLLDKTIGQLLSASPKGTRVILVSDHGFTSRSKQHPTPLTVPFTGEHRIEGVVFVSGPGIRPGIQIVGATIYHVAPTVLDLLGIEYKVAFEGRSLCAQIEDLGDGGKEHPGFDRRLQQEDPILEAPFKEEEVDRLRSLGYVE